MQTEATMYSFFTDLHEIKFVFMGYLWAPVDLFDMIIAY